MRDTRGWNDLIPIRSTGAHTAWLLLFAAWLVALAATFGALFIGEVLGREPCLLCWYQRIAMFPLAIILGIACLRDDPGVRYYALPLALGGSMVALWHSGLFFGLISEAIEQCGQGPSCTSDEMTVFGGIPLPLLSVGAFASVSVLLGAIDRRETNDE